MHLSSFTFSSDLFVNPAKTASCYFKTWIACKHYCLAGSPPKSSTYSFWGSWLFIIWPLVLQQATQTLPWWQITSEILGKGQSKSCLLKYHPRSIVSWTALSLPLKTNRRIACEALAGALIIIVKIAYDTQVLTKTLQCQRGYSQGREGFCSICYNHIVLV